MQPDRHARMTRMDYATVAAAAVGRWPDILAALGIDDRHLTRRHGPCPGCGGKDRFRFDDRDGRGTWICGGGGNPQAGDGFRLLRHVYGWTAAESLHAVARYLGMDTDAESPPPRTAPRPEPPVAPPEPSRTAAYATELRSRVNRDSAAVASHPYAIARGIGWHAGAGRVRASGSVIGRDADSLIVPIRTIPERTVAALQCIDAAGNKQTFGPTKGHACILGHPYCTGAAWWLVEGWADAVSIFRRERGAVVAAAMGRQFDDVAQRIAAAWSPRRLIVVEDAP
jgi:putative DNA primase/helicase